MEPSTGKRPTSLPQAVTPMTGMHYLQRLVKEQMREVQTPSNTKLAAMDVSTKLNFKNDADAQADALVNACSSVRTQRIPGGNSLADGTHAQTHAFANAHDGVSVKKGSNAILANDGNLKSIATLDINISADKGERQSVQY